MRNEEKLVIERKFVLSAPFNKNIKKMSLEELRDVAEKIGFPKNETKDWQEREFTTKMKRARLIEDLYYISNDCKDHIGSIVTAESVKECVVKYANKGETGIFWDDDKILLLFLPSGTLRELAVSEDQIEFLD